MDTHLMRTPVNTSKRDNRECVTRTESIRFAIAPTTDHIFRCVTGTAMKVFAAPAPALPGFRPTPNPPGASPASVGLVPSSRCASRPGCSGRASVTRCDGRAISGTVSRGDAHVERTVPNLPFPTSQEEVVHAASSTKPVAARTAFKQVPLASLLRAERLASWRRRSPHATVAPSAAP